MPGALSASPDFLRRVEEAGLNALPAPRQVLLDGWVLRFAGGFTGRANSVTVLDEGAVSDTKIAACEALYAAQALPPAFRVVSFHDGALDRALTARGYAPAAGESLVLEATLGAITADPGIELTERPGEDWLIGLAALSGGHDAARRAILAGLAVPSAFAAVRVGGALVSFAFGAVHDGLLAVNMVATDPTFRRRGFSRRCVGAVMGWATGAGALQACLQVGAENAAAIALYRRLGFGAELYRYRYRRRAG